MADSKKVYLQIISPLHIGCKDRAVYPFEWVRSENALYVLSEARLSAYLLKKNLLNSHLNEFEKKGSGFALQHFLQKNGLLTQDFLDATVAYKVHAHRTPPREFKPFVRDAFNRPFIPGSSLKGAMRTAILYGMLKQKKEDDPHWFRNSIVQKVEHKLTEIKRKGRPTMRDKRDFSKRFLLSLLTDYTLPRERQPNPRTDILRILKVSDTQPLHRDALEMEETKVLSHKEQPDQQATMKGFSAFCETMPQGSVLTFDLKVDPGILHEFAQHNTLPQSLGSIEGILTACAAMSADLKKAEQDYLRALKSTSHAELTALSDFYQTLDGNFRLGFGGGLLSKTVAMLLPAELRKDLRDTLWHRRHSTLAPKSRNVIVAAGQPDLAFGWCKLALQPLAATTVKRQSAPKKQTMEKTFANEAEHFADSLQKLREKFKQD